MFGGTTIINQSGFINPGLTLIKLIIMDPHEHGIVWGVDTKFSDKATFVYQTNANKVARISQHPHFRNVYASEKQKRSRY